MSHALKYNGAPYLDDAKLLHTDSSITAGEGRALCACGELSPVLASGKARRTWFKEHKLQALDAEVTAEKAALQDVLDGTPEDEVHEALAELVAEPKPAKAKAPRKAKETPGVDDAASEPNAHTQQLLFSQSGVVPGFWRSLGRDATQTLVDSEFPTVTVTPNNNSMTLVLQGPEADVQEALQAVKDMWAEALVASKEWKKTDPEFLGRSTERLARRQEGYHLTEGFYRGFGQQFVEWRRGA